jgi:hypothetical protein
MFTRLMFVIGVAILSVWAGGTAANAQYPPSPDQVVLAAANPSPEAGETVSIAASARDASGAPLAGVACSFEITSQLAGATVNPTTATTNEDGVATTNLQVGSSTGTIVIEATCGEASDTLSVTVAGPPADEPAEPPASLPDTGSDSGSETGGTMTLIILVLAAASLVGLPGAGYLVYSRRR